MTMRSRTLRMVAVAGAAVLLGLVTAVPAAAHPGDPTLVNRLVETELPAGVTTELRTTVGEELVVTNPSPTPLVALDVDGTPFLRISASGVEGNATSPFFYRSAAPQEVRITLPRDAVPGAPPRWVALSAAPSWSWFDPRLSPQYLQVPVGGRQDVSDTQVVATWSVPLRYGDEPVAVEGTLVRRPVTGRFDTTLDTPPAGLSAVLSPGFVPSLSVQPAPGHAVTVMGRDGTPFLRFGPDGAEVNRANPTYRDDLIGRGKEVTAADSGWLAVPGTSTTWLDTRLRFPSEDPPAEFADAQVPADVVRWEIPVTIDGTPQMLTGAIRWLPNGHADSGSPWTTVGLIGGIVVLVGLGAVLVVRNRRLAAASRSDDTQDVHEHEHA